MKTKLLNMLSIAEILIAIITIAYDLFMPTLVILVLMSITLLVRRQSLASIGFKKEPHWLRMALIVLLASIAWTIITLGITLPVLMHLTHQQQDLSQFMNLKGNINQLLIFLGFTWTLAAFGEEIVYRGYIQQRIVEVMGNKTGKYLVAILVSSMLFGIAHTEQGIIGVVITGIDALYFSLIRKYFHHNLWASVLAHGFNNTIGLVGFYLLGPIYSFW